MSLNKLVFTNGCFDILHPGHIQLLQKAKAAGDKLVVGLNSDEHISRKKNRLPRFALNDRKLMLEACKFVDVVLSFNQEDAVSLIDALRPDVYVTGEEYKDRSPEARLVTSYGGKVIYVKRIGEYSSSKYQP